VKLFRVVAEVENYDANTSFMLRFFAPEELKKIHAKTLLVGGMAAFDLPGVKAPNYRGKVGRFWYTARGWKAAKVAKFLAAEGKGVTYTVKVIEVRKSEIIWTDGTQAIVRKS
jgi:hypothetical protein